MSRNRKNNYQEESKMRDRHQSDVGNTQENNGDVKIGSFIANPRRSAEVITNAFVAVADGVNVASEGISEVSSKLKRVDGVDFNKLAIKILLVTALILLTLACGGVLYTVWSGGVSGISFKVKSIIISFIKGTGEVNNTLKQLMCDEERLISEIITLKGVIGDNKAMIEDNKVELNKLSTKSGSLMSELSDLKITNIEIITNLKAGKDKLNKICRDLNEVVVVAGKRVMWDYSAEANIPNNLNVNNKSDRNSQLKQLMRTITDICDDNLVDHPVEKDVVDNVSMIENSKIIDDNDR